MCLATSLFVCAVSLTNCGPQILPSIKLPDAQSSGAHLMPRVRSDSPRIVEAIQQATQRSTTFKRLVAAIENSDGIVFIVGRTCGRGVRSCLLLRVTPAARYRILFIKVDPRKAGNELMTTIGHELQHAVEVLSDASLTNDLAIFYFYDRFVPTDRGRFETEAAIRAGLYVQAEVKAWEKARSRCSRPREGCGPSASASQDSATRQNSAQASVVRPASLVDQAKVDFTLSPVPKVVPDTPPTLSHAETTVSGAR